MGKNRNRWNLLKSELIEPLYRTLDEINAQSESIREFAFSFNLAHRFLSLHTLTGLDEASVSKDKKNKVTLVEMDPAQFANLIFSVDHSKIENMSYDNTFYHKAQSIHHLLSDVGDGLYISRQFLSSEQWKKSEIIEHGMRFVGSHPLKQWIQDELIKRKKVVPFEKMVPRRYLSKKIDAAKRFFKSLTPSLLSYTPSFIFSNGDERGVIDRTPNERYRVLSRAKKMGKIPTLTIFDFEKLVIRDEFHVYLEKNPGPIRFKIPIELKSGPPKTDVTLPFELATEQSHILIKDLYVGFRDGDDEIRHFTDSYAFSLPRTYLSEIVPWEEVPADFPRRHLVHEVDVWTELELDIPLEYMRTRSKPSSLV
jgi:hypothetical protein